MKRLTLTLLALCLTGCRSTIPADTSILVGGKNPQAVHVGGLTWKEALSRIGQVAIRVGGQIAMNAGVNYLNEKYGPPADRGK